MVNLSDIRTGKRIAPDRIMMLGVEGVGKSTFGSESPSPIFVAAEDGIRNLDVASFPEPKCFDNILGMIKALREEDHGYKTFVLDSLDWLEPIIWRKICLKYKWADIEEPGYGKGFTIALDYWRKVLNGLDSLRVMRGMEIILIGHIQIRTFNNPAGEDYARFEGKLNPRAYGLVKEWCDMVLFAEFEEFTIEGKGFAKGKYKGVSSGKRVMHTQRCAAWDAKNRYNLPDKLPLGYTHLKEAITNQPDPDEIIKEVHALMDLIQADEEQRAKTEELIIKFKNSIPELLKLVNVLRTRVEERGLSDN